MATPEEIAQMQAMAGAQPVPIPPTEQAAMSDADWLVAQREGRIAPAAPPSTLAPASQPAPVEQPPAPRYLSRPSAPASNPFAVVANVPGASQTTVARTDLGSKGGEARAASDKAFAAAQGALEKQTSVEEQRAAVIAEGAAAKAQEQVKYEALAAEQAQRAKLETDRALTEKQGAVAKFERVSDELDPNRFWHKQSTGQTIGNLIAIALSGIGQVFSAKGGNPNARNGALDMINLAIDRDIDMQKTALSAAERGVRIKESAYAAARAAGADDAQAIALSRASALARIDAQSQAKAATLGTQEARARAEALSAQLQQARAAELQKVAEIEATRVQSSVSSQPILAGQLQAAQTAEQAKAAGLVPVDPSLATPLGQARDPESKREMAKAHLAFTGAEKALDRMEVLRKKGGKLGNWTSKDKAAFESLRTDLLAFAKGDYGAKLGVLTGPDLELINPQIPTNEAWQTLTGASDVKLQMLRQKIDEAKQAVREGYGVKTSL